MDKDIDNIVKNFETTIFPMLDSLRRKSNQEQQLQIDLIKNYLRDITSSFGRTISSNELGLTSREIEVCQLIKEGLNTQKIANILCTSKRTIDNHRNHIRKKLGISRDKASLVDVLKRF